MTFKERYGDTALVAGASEGLGAAYANALAARGLNLVLIARRKQQLEETATQISKQHNVNVVPIVCDLAETNVIKRLQPYIGDININFLVYNAASSYIGPFLSTGLSTHKNIASVNMLTQLEMLYYFGGKMAEKHRGGIVIMTSIAGLQGSGYLSTYAATKAFSRGLAEGLWYEWKPKGIDVIACCAGAIATPNYIATKPGKAGWLEPLPQLPEKVVEECLNKIGKKPFFISGTGNKLAVFIMQNIFSKQKAVRVMGDSMKKMYRIAD